MCVCNGAGSSTEHVKTAISFAHCVQKKNKHAKSRKVIFLYLRI